MATHIPPLPNLNSKTKNETLALLHGIYAGLIGFSILVFLYLEYQQASISTLSLGMVLLLLGGLVFFNIQASIKVKQGNGSGRTLSRIMAILMLLSFPIGTVLGVIALWKSSARQWQD
ncbi:hypothetical protein F906_01762 [Acinetobacter pseudolwoffii]|uniref:Uncharacterized protein n=1 Tax=Acinetobacter pseudolwoffii TaxID=2053287 RepID=N9KRU2_9GAMM|nr:hypothetical protein [Acinetobacter pseudolwoffii]ENW86698.1 hypothetical protein F906_01762 [Acinetobacter pseudolwoffii]